MNIPGQPSPFMVVDQREPQIKLWAEPYVDKPGLFNTYPHWPISRGLRTTWLDDPAQFERPTHSNLANIVSDEAERLADHRIWYWLIGVTPSERDLRLTAGSWLAPAELTVSGGESKGYDKTQRAYIIVADPAARRLDITLRADAITNPAFVIQGASRWLTAATCPGAKRLLTGRERAGKDLVVWVEGEFARGLTLSLR